MTLFFFLAGRLNRRGVQRRMSLGKVRECRKDNINGVRNKRESSEAPSRTSQVNQVMVRVSSGRKENVERGSVQGGRCR